MPSYEELMKKLDQMPSDKVFTKEESLEFLGITEEQWEKKIASMKRAFRHAQATVDSYKNIK